MKKAIRKIFIFSLLILIVYTIPKIVFAEGEQENKEESRQCKAAKRTLGNMYGTNIKYNVDIEIPTFELSISSEKLQSTIDKIFRLEKEEVAFKIARILIAKNQDRVVDYFDYLEDESKLEKVEEGTDYDNADKLKYYFNINEDDILTVDNSISFPNIRNDAVTYYVILESVNDDKLLEHICEGENSKSIIALVISVPEGKPIYRRESRIVPIQIYQNVVQMVDCGALDENHLPTTEVYKTKYDSKSFEYNYCQDLYNAKKSGVVPIVFTEDYPTQKDYINATNNSINSSFKCNPFSLLTKREKNENELYDYANKNYLVGEVKRELQIGYYLYNYGGQYLSDEQMEELNIDKTSDKLIGMRMPFGPAGMSIDESKIEKEPVSCNVECKEVVTVEYGPPVATTAGMCFEYRVRVTSRVSCNGDVADPPREVDEYCTPIPICKYQSSSATYHSAGPNEDYDDCIISCDGGQYTDKCSNKCYNEVYNSSKELQKSNSLSYENSIEKLANAQPADAENKYKGFYYTRPTDKKIVWDPENRLGRWYKEYSHSGFSCNKTKTEGGGISAICSCSMICSWTGCNDGVGTYLNPWEAESDHKRNKELYNRAIDACTKYSKCSTSQLTFSLNVDYSYDEDKQPIKIYFPYSQNKENVDTIKYISDEEKSCPTGKETTLISSKGCYDCKNNIILSNVYQIEWGLPKSWINNKTGEISYEPKNPNTWSERTFCLPFDTKNVNEKWWNAYYMYQLKENNTNNIQVSYFDNEYNEKIERCKVECDSINNIGEFNERDVSNLKYNIFGNTTSFGLFDWNIDVSCFYALNDNFPSSGETNCEVKDCPVDPKEVPYAIRSVDLGKLFPSSGTTNSDRSPGFNWSKYATVSKEKVALSEETTSQAKNYTSYPEKYINWIQSKRYEVYSDEYLDYYVKLTKDIIRDLKLSDKDYTSFEGETYVGDVVNYRSKLFEQGGLLSGDNNIYPNMQALKCNNIGNKFGKAGYEAECFYVEDLKPKSNE